MMTGNTHPRLTNEDVVNLVVPVPKPAIQEFIAAEVQRRRREEARRLRAEAEAGWQAAKQWFERQLLG
jgi:neutral trehalase